MRITEILMRPGGWQMSLRADTPPSVLDTVRDGMAVYDSTDDRLESVMDAQIVVFDTDTDTPSLARARYTGILEAQSGDRSFSGPGLAAYMGTDDGLGFVTTSVYEARRDSLYDVVDDLEAAGMLNGLTPGTDYTPGDTTNDTMAITAPVTAREILDEAARAFGKEYRVNPDGTIDVGEPADGLFVTTPRVLIDSNPGGQFGAIRRINGAPTGFAINCAPVTKRVYLFPSDFAAFETATAVPVIGRGLAGAALVRDRAVNYGTGQDDDAANASTSTLNLFQYPRSSFDIEATDRYVRRFVQPGDTVYVYFPEAGIRSKNVIDVGGLPVQPQKVRVHEIDWGVHQGHGVWLRRHDGADETWFRLTEWVEFADPGSAWKVGTARGPLDGPALGGPARLGNGDGEVPYVDPPPAITVGGNGDPVHVPVWGGSNSE